MDSISNWITPPPPHLTDNTFYSVQCDENKPNDTEFRFTAAVLLWNCMSLNAIDHVEGMG